MFKFVFMNRLISILLTTGFLFSMIESAHREKPVFVPGEDLPQAPFSCTAEDEDHTNEANDTALAFNAVYRLFGGVDKDNCLVAPTGNEPTWFEWMAIKTAWCNDDEYIRMVKNLIRDFPQTDNGYLWSWGSSVYWPTGNGDIHYDGLFRYIAAVAEFIRWSGNTSFLEETDRTTYGSDLSLDASEGRTVYEKCALAMQYATEELDGKNGLITITEKSAYLADGVTRFDRGANGEYVWNNTGLRGSSPSNYWDNLCFGNKDAYETALFYHALEAMRDIETMRGDNEAAADCQILSQKVKNNFNATFWNPLTGRYIGCIDTEGKKWDGGFTFLNVEALAYGLGDAGKADKIFSWLDGTRTVASDTLRGKDIMDYAVFLNHNIGKKTAESPMPFAPVSNTLSIERLSGFGEPWWHSLNGAINTGYKNNAFYGRHLENGGYIFYTVFYELTARQMYLGADSVKKRACQLADIYRFNGFNSDIGGWAEGLTGEFPESGIVSRAFISTLAGINASTDGLTISPAVPGGIKTLGVEKLQYRDILVDVTVARDGLILKADSALSGNLHYYPSVSGEYIITITRSDGEYTQSKSTADPNSVIDIDLNGREAVYVRVFME